MSTARAERDRETGAAPASAPGPDAVLGPRARTVLVVAAATVLLAGLGLLGIDRKSFWLDEAYTWSTVSRSWPAFVHLVRTSESGGVAYSLVMFAWERLGSGEAVMRLPSVVFAAACVPVVYRLGERLFGRRAGLIAAVLLAVNASVVEYAQEARSYALMLLVVSICCLGFVGEVRRPTRATWLAWVVAGGLVPYVHPLSVGIFAAQGLSLLAARPGSVRWRRFLGGALAIAVLATPIVALTVTQSSGFVPSLEGGRTPWAVLRAAGTIAGKGGLVLALLYAGTALAAVVVAVGIARRQGRSSTLWPFAFTLAWIVVPMLFVVAASYASPNFHARYFLVSLPGLVLLASAALSRIESRLVAGVALAAIVAGSLFGVWRLADRPKDDWRDAATYVSARARPGDGVVFLGDEGRIAFEYYLRDDRDATRRLQPVYPGAAWRHFGTNDDATVLASPSVMRDAADHYERLWVVSDSIAGGPHARLARRQLRALTGAGMTLASFRAFEPQVAVRLYERAGRPAPSPR